MRRTMTGIAVAGAVLVTGSPAQATPTKAAAPPWVVGQSNKLSGEDGIKALTVAPTTSTWAGGYQASNGKSVPLVQHLLSGKWTTVKSPSSLLGEVTAISASYSKNVWAFGATGTHA